MRSLNKHRVLKIIVACLLLVSTVPILTLATARTADALPYNCAKGKVWSQNQHKCIDNSKLKCDALTNVYDSVDGCISSLPSCPSGQVYTTASATCIANKANCTSGQIYDASASQCRMPTPDEIAAGPPLVACPDGSKALTQSLCSANLAGGNSAGGQCGSGDNAVHVGINLGCKGVGNPIADLTFAIIRFLSIGVGMVIVGSMVYAGVQYTISRGDPQATAQAITRIRSNVVAIIVFAFAYAILNYVVPGQVLK